MANKIIEALRRTHDEMLYKVAHVLPHPKPLWIDGAAHMAYPVRDDDGDDWHWIAVKQQGIPRELCYELDGKSDG